MRSVTVALLLAACNGGPVDPDGPPTGSGLVQAELVAGPAVICADPTSRSATVFDDKSAAEQTVSGAYLHGGGALVEDLDGDGWMDLLLPSEVSAQLFWGRAGQVEDLFEDAHETLRGLPVSMAVGATAADYDGDGDLDVLLTRWQEPNTLLRNNGDRTFTDVSVQAFGVGAPAWRHQSASWADVDADGDLDLFVGSYGEWTILDVLDPTPDCSDHLADPAELWINQGDGTFVDEGDRLPQEVHDGYSFMSGFYDLDDDGYPELFSAHDDGLCGPSVLVDNDGQSWTVDAASGFHPDAHDMGMAVGDLNDDELPDFLMTSWNGAYYVQSTWTADGVRWIDFADAKGLVVDAAPQDNPGQAQPGQQVYGWGAEFGDVDNDGDLDAAMVFGFWSVFDGAGDPMQQRDGLWVQGPDGTFEDQAAAWGLDHPGIGRSVVLADINGDGWLDSLKRVLDNQSPLQVSRCGEASWVRIQLRAPGGNTHAIGARIRLWTGDGRQVRWIHSGSAGMYTGSPQEAHFGLGAAETIDRLEVVWPDGGVSRFDDVEARRLLTITRTE